MEILLLFLARFLLSELYGVNPQVILLIAFLLLIFNFVKSPVDFLKITNRHKKYFIAISLLLIISLYNVDIYSILNIFILLTLPFIKYKSSNYSKYIVFFVIISTIIYCFIILTNFSVYINRSHNYLLLGRGILVCQAFLLFANYQKLKYLKLPISVLFLVGLAIMHGRLNAIVSLLLIILFLLKNFKYSWIFLSLTGLISTILINFISNLNIGTVKRLLEDQDSITDRIGLVQSASSELQNIETLFFGGGLNFSQNIAFKTLGYPYIHNLPLELLLDYGLFSLPILFIWGLMLVRSTKIIFLRKEILLSVLLFVETFQFFKSFEFDQSISLFLIITLLINEKNEL
jgi:hypothetical protein